MKDEPVSPVSVTTRVSAILGAFSDDLNRLGLSELTRRSGLAKATAYRLCEELVAVGLLQKVGAQYELGGRLFELGQRVPRSTLLRDAALPFMQDLFVATSETVHFSVRDGLDVFYVEKLMGHRGVRSPSRVAGRLPLHCTASGKAVLASSDRQLFDRVVSAGLAPRTRYTVRDASLLRRQLDEARSQGFAVEREELRIGFASVASAVTAQSGLIGALSVTGSIDGDPQRWGPAVRTAALGLTRALAGSLYSHRA